MKRILVFCAFCALSGCKQANVPETEPIALYYSTTEASKTDILSQGDEIGVFAAVEGTEKYFAENTKYIVGSDGRSLSTSPALYYPEAKQAVVFTAYLPFGGTWSGALGTFSVPADQSTSLKQADLCWAKASSTPVATPVALEFQHKMARLLITTNTPTTKIVAPNAFSGGTLDIRTGAFTPIQKSTISTTGTELILPAQTLSRLILTVAGIDYTFDGVIALESAKATSINLTLNATTHTATLSGSSTTNWIASTTSGNPTQAVSNVLTMHWPNYLPQGATPDKVVLTINNTDYTVSSGITYADKSFTVPFASSALRYPYTITKITFPNFPTCTQLLGATIYKSASQTVGIKDPVPNAVLINGIWWATGNLIADGPNGCKIGAPTDCGLYFQFGSLIGWSGGEAIFNYDGRGAFSSIAATVKVRPANLHSSYEPCEIWPTQGGSTLLNKPYFSLETTPYNQATPISSYQGDATSNNIRDDTKADLISGRYAPNGIGDPCRYYLGHSWRVPTISHCQKLFGVTPPNTRVPTVGATLSYSTPLYTVSRNGIFVQFVYDNQRINTNAFSGDGTRYQRAAFLTDLPNGTAQCCVFVNMDSNAPNYINMNPGYHDLHLKTIAVAARCVMES